MNKKVKVFDYFKQGYNLALKSWDLFLIGLFLTLLANLPDLMGDSFIKGTLQVIGFLLLFVGFGFSFSLPVFLLGRQEGKDVDFGNILSTSLQNTKRLILPLIPIGIVFIVIMFIGLLLVVQFIYGGDFNFMQNAQTQGFSAWNILFALLIGSLSFGTFTSIYFSLEKNSLFSSIKKSVSLSVKHLDFIIILFVISASIFLISVLFLNNYQSFWQLFLRSVVYGYTELLMIAVSLIFYQSHRGE